tara:strand:+ start:611 stop:727 length:117 start_codon:yes stop_codon:yes gene_type:complete
MKLEKLKTANYIGFVNRSLHETQRLLLTKVMAFESSEV